MESTGVAVDYQLEEGFTSPPSSENTRADISEPEGYDMMIDVLWLVMPNIYKDEVKNIKYLNKALYENTFIKENKELKTVISYDRRNLEQGPLRIEKSFYFLSSLKYKNRVILHGKYCIYYSDRYAWHHMNQNIKKVMMFNHGKKHGSCKEYDRFGVLRKETNYDNGRKHGKYYIYDEDNNRHIHGYYNHGVKDGLYRVDRYFGGFYTVFACNYVNNKRHGLAKCYRRKEGTINNETVLYHTVLYVNDETLFD